MKLLKNKPIALSFALMGLLFGCQQQGGTVEESLSFDQTLKVHLNAIKTGNI